MEDFEDVILEDLKRGTALSSAEASLLFALAVLKNSLRDILEVVAFLLISDAQLLPSVAPFLKFFSRSDCLIIGSIFFVFLFLLLLLLRLLLPVTCRRC